MKLVACDQLHRLYYNNVHLSGTWRTQPMTTWDATLYDQKHSFVFQYGQGVLDLLEAQAGEYILDLGCGTGHLTKAIADTGARVLGIDGAASMIEQARQN